MIEQTDGRLQVSSRGKVIPSQLVPPRPGLMRVGSRAGKSRRTLERQLEKVSQQPTVVPVRNKRKELSPDEPRSAATTDPASSGPLEGGAADKVKGALAAGDRPRARNCPGHGAQIRQVSAAAAEPVRRKRCRPGHAGAGRRDQQARIPGTRSLTFLLDSWSDIVAEQRHTGGLVPVIMWTVGGGDSQSAGG